MREGAPKPYGSAGSDEGRRAGRPRSATTRSPRPRPLTLGPVPSVFSRIIEGELPGTFVWRDDRCVAILSINPVQPGHLLVIPRAEIDQWTDLDPTLAAHLVVVAQTLANAVLAAFAPRRVGLVIAGLEVPHAHLHVIPIHNGEADLHFDRARDATPEELAANAAEIRTALRALGADGLSG
jgi:histidine triad (HIT) family protein